MAVTEFIFRFSRIRPRRLRCPKKNEPQPLESNWGSTPGELRVRGWGASPGVQALTIVPKRCSAPVVFFFPPKSSSTEEEY